MCGSNVKRHTNSVDRSHSTIVKCPSCCPVASGPVVDGLMEDESLTGGPRFQSKDHFSGVQPIVIPELHIRHLDIGRSSQNECAGFICSTFTNSVDDHENSCLFSI